MSVNYYYDNKELFLIFDKFYIQLMVFFRNKIKNEDDIKIDTLLSSLKHEGAIIDRYRLILRVLPPRVLT